MRGLPDPPHSIMAIHSDPDMIDSTRTLVRNFVGDGNAIAQAIFRILVALTVILVLLQLNSALNGLFGGLTGKVSAIG